MKNKRTILDKIKELEHFYPKAHPPVPLVLLDDGREAYIIKRGLLGFKNNNGWWAIPDSSQAKWLSPEDLSLCADLGIKSGTFTPTEGLKVIGEE